MLSRWEERAVVVEGAVYSNGRSEGVQNRPKRIETSLCPLGKLFIVLELFLGVDLGCCFCF